MLVDDGARSALALEIGGDLLDELTGNFCREATQMLGSASEAIAARNTAVAIRELHTLKGVAGTLGFRRIELAAGAAQFSVEAGEAPDLPALQSILLRTVLATGAAPGPAIASLAS